MPSDNGRIVQREPTREHAIKALILLGALSLSACSQRQVYEAVQQNRQFECQKERPSQYEECKDSYNQSYDDYASERDELKKERSETIRLSP